VVREHGPGVALVGVGAWWAGDDGGRCIDGAKAGMEDASGAEVGTEDVGRKASGSSS
jgi:hypothetical protein